MEEEEGERREGPGGWSTWCWEKSCARPCPMAWISSTELFWETRRRSSAIRILGGT